MLNTGMLQTRRTWTVRVGSRVQDTTGAGVQPGGQDVAGTGAQPCSQVSSSPARQCQELTPVHHGEELHVCGRTERRWLVRLMEVCGVAYDMLAFFLL